MTGRGLLDTSVYIARESGRPLRRELVPEETFVCVVTVAELEAGVLSAPDTQARQMRLGSLQAASRLVPLTIDHTTASRWAGLRMQLRDAGRRMPVNDLWIAAVALSHDLSVVTQDDDFDALAELGLLEVIKV